MTRQSQYFSGRGFIAISFLLALAAFGCKSSPAGSDANGKFEMKNLPPGEYTLGAIHEKFGEQTAHVRVLAKESAKTDFVFSPAA